MESKTKLKGEYWPYGGYCINSNDNNAPCLSVILSALCLQFVVLSQSDKKSYKLLCDFSVRLGTLAHLFLAVSTFHLVC